MTLAAAAYAGGGISGGVYNPAVALGLMIFGSLTGAHGFNSLIIYLIGSFAGAILAAWSFKYFNSKDS
ncbi:aquaporin [Candidatus Woesearchaeota archaeon]|nr:aquaporin [Candidatus Woesearchaeota archaeon]